MCPHVSASWLRPVLTGGGGGGGRYEWVATHYTPPLRHAARSSQGRSCKQISWPPGIGGLQGVGLDPGQHDHHPHGVVHVGQLQDV